MSRHKGKARPMKRSTIKLVFVCKRCRTDLPKDDRGCPRSNTWAYRMPGVRFVFCSPDCRDAHDDEVRSGWKETEEG